MPRLLIAPRELEIVERQALAAFPDECCGLLIGDREEGGAVRVGWVEPCPNDARGSRRRRFTIAAESLLAAYRRAREAGHRLVGTYHSHTAGPAVPSAADRASAWPGASYLIVGLGRGGVRERRSWRFSRAGRFVEQELAAAR